jgi:hypothetical protein
VFAVKPRAEGVATTVGGGPAAKFADVFVALAVIEAGVNV